MSISTTLNFDTGINWDYDSDKVEFTGGTAQLKLQNDPSQLFPIDFSSDAGFTYDSAKAEFSGGKLQQKSQRPTNATFGAKYTTSATANWCDGFTNGSLIAGANVAGGKLNLVSSTSGCIYSSPNNANLVQTGAVKFKFTPNYNGYPVSQSFLFNYGGSASPYRNQINIFHSSTGALYINIKNNAGVTIVNQNCGTWTAVLGVSIELELNFNVTIGATRLFMNGSQFGATDTNTGTRDLTDCNLIVIGNSATYIYGTIGSIDDLVFFSTVQHTANYTPGYTLPDADYLMTDIITPELEYTGLGTLISFDDFVTVESGTPRYTIQIGQSGNYLYWNGSAWVTSNGTYSQANDAATFDANVGSLPVSGEIYGQFKIYFTDSGSQSYIDNLQAELTAQTYQAGDQSIESKTGITSDDFTSFTSVNTAPANTDIGFVIKVLSSYYYHNGAAWVASDQSIAQSNTAQEIEDNLDSLVTEDYIIIYPVAILNTDGSATPDITSITSVYEFYETEGSEIPECIINFYIEDLLGDNYEDATFTVYSKKAFWHSDKQILPFEKSTVANEDGYIRLSVIETASISQYLYFKLSYTNPNTNATQVVKYKKAIVPNQTSIQGKDLLTI